MAFTPEDLLELADVVAGAWASGLDRDWSAPAGTLDWSCARTADHAVDTVLAPAFFLASRLTDRYPEYGASTPGPDAAPATYVEAVGTAARILAAVVRDTDPAVRAVIWRAPEPETRPPADFAPRGGFELAVHAHDVCAGLGVAFDPPRPLCERLRADVEDWPYWPLSPGWKPLAMDGDPWLDILTSAGRLRS